MRAVKLMTDATREGGRMLLVADFVDLVGVGLGLLASLVFR